MLKYDCSIRAYESIVCMYYQMIWTVKGCSSDHTLHSCSCSGLSILSQYLPISYSVPNCLYGTTSEYIQIIQNFCGRFVPYIPIIRSCFVLSKFQFTGDSDSRKVKTRGQAMESQVRWFIIISVNSL